MDGLKNPRVGLPLHPTSSSQQQKRQNSVSSYMVQPSTKRVPNNLPPLADSDPALTRTASANNAPNHMHMRKSLIQQQQQQQQRSQSFNHTPTPSSYGVPSSPNHQVTPGQNNSDSPDSNELPSQPQPSQPQLLQSQPGFALQMPANAARAPAPAATLHKMSDEEQQLATKLKETYKNIVNYEETVQKACIDLSIKINQSAAHGSGGTTPSSSHQQAYSPSPSASSITKTTSELSNDLWTVYHHNITLLDNYYDFLVTALKPSSNQTNFKTGKNIVDLYKIPRRMWVYGIVGFLEVLKNIMNIFQDHEICSCFISHCFTIISSLTDPILEMEGWWGEKLGDLSRMAIALYSSRFIDWKISAEYWYSVSMKTLYGHGKIYYHMCTVQQDNLDALVNIGKSVFCHDPFVPTQQYLRLVVENICTQRNILSLLELPSIDFIKIHKVLLSIYPSIGGNNSANDAAKSSIQDTQLQYGIDLVTRYGLTFGSDPNGFNFFTKELYTPQAVNSDPHHPYYSQRQQGPTSSGVPSSIASNNSEKLNFWYNKGPLFAIVNINHLVGFGDARNPFAKLFELPEALKERKDKKDRKRKSRTLSTGSNPQADDMASPVANASATITNGPVDGLSFTASDLSVTDWFICLQYVNKSVMELSIRILHNYLVGPKQASTCHMIVWLYFLISVGEATNKYPKSKPMMMWVFRKMIPWDSLIRYLNSILVITQSSAKLSAKVRTHITRNDANSLVHFDQNEFLPEVWKCWGTLWFDFVANKGDYVDLNEAGVANENIFDLPISGTSPVINISNATTGSAAEDGSVNQRNSQSDMNDERVIRILLLARHLADNYNFGLVRTSASFKFDKFVYDNMDSLEVSEVFPFIEKFLFGDGRFMQNNFLQPISSENLHQRFASELDSKQKDKSWFGAIDDDGDLDEDERFVGDDDLVSYGESEFDEEDYDYESQQRSNVQQQLQHQHQQSPLGHDPFHHPNVSHQAQHNQILDQMQYQHMQQHQQLHQQARLYGSTDAHHYEPDMMSDVNYQDNHKCNMSESHPIDDTSLRSLEGNLGYKMDTNVTYITLDTNIWLKHCGRVFKCIRNGIFKISIPLIVFQELRSLRKSAEATIADSATRSVIIIRELYLSREILPLRFDGTVASDINETTEFENNTNWRTSVDGTILNSVNEHDEIGKKLMKGLNMPLSGKTKVVLDAKASKVFNYCILITDDRNMRLRAKSIGLTSFPSRWLFSVLEAMFAASCID
ncbi:DNA/RNA-binding domain-containing protein [[Candida] zeylanoides]